VIKYVYRNYHESYLIFFQTRDEGENPTFGGGFGGGFTGGMGGGGSSAFNTTEDDESWD
jgi:hypothetical protein